VVSDSLKDDPAVKVAVDTELFDTWMNPAASMSVWT